MKLEQLCYAASLGAVLCLAQSAFATDYHWTGLANDGLWSSAGNWDSGVPVGPGNAGFLDAANGWSIITITNTDDITVPDMVYGPEWGITLNIHGKVHCGSYTVPVQSDPAGWRSIINVYSNATYYAEGIALGDSWWWSGGPYVTMNMYGNAFAGIRYMYWGGRLNMYGGTMSITNGVTVQTVDAVSDTTRSINLAGGTLILPGGFTGAVNDWISRGILLAYGKAQDNSDIIIDTVTLPGRTRVTTIPLGGSLQEIHLQSISTNVTVGVFQLTVLGKYPNVSNVVLTSLDPATLPGTIVYLSSDPNVATVDAKGRVYAIATGSATLTATLGVFSSTNSITITVSPADAIPRLPEEQPVLGYAYVHDPSTVIKEGSFYYTFCTGQGIGVRYSTDMRNWSYADPVFIENPPAWTTIAVPSFTGGFWAPDIAYFNGKYHLYYSCSAWGTIDSAIGLITTPSLTSPTWTDQGKVIQSDATWEAGPDTDLTSYNCIDPCVLVDTNGTVWLSFGSYSDGILVMQLDPATGKRIATNSPITKIANNGPVFFSNTTEGSCLYQRGGYYYLFLNFGGCCSGVDSTYNIRVGRSTSVTGLYRDRNNVPLTSGGGTLLLESTGRFIGPGHAGIFNENGTNWFTYHYYDGNDNGVAKLGLKRLFWTDDGWPALTNSWSAFYTFDVDAREHLAQYNGTLRNGAAVTNELGRGKVLSLEPTNKFVTLPLSVANASSFATWVKWNGGGDWQRIFDFGSGTTKYLFLTPRANNGKMRFAITTNGGGSERMIDAPTALSTSSWQHVAVTLDGSRGVMYLNGQPVGTNASLTIRPWQILARSNYFGKSQWPDPTFNGKLDSFRVFGRALSAAEVKDLAYAQPALAHRYSFTSNAWDSIGLAHGTLQGNATITNNTLRLTGASGGYVNLPGGLVSGSSAVTVEFWATFGVNGDWAHVLDFGNITNNNGQNYLFFSPHTSLGGLRLGILTAGGTVNFDPAGTFDNHTLHVVCIADPPNGYMAVYTNGVLRASTNTSLPPLSGISTAWSFLGRSLSSGDAWLNGTIDELRIYDGTLTPEAIGADHSAGPDKLALPVTLAQSNSPSGWELSWPAWAVGFVSESAFTLSDNSIWTPLALSPTLGNDRWRQTLATTNDASFFRLRR